MKRLLPFLLLAPLLAQQTPAPPAAEAKPEVEIKNDAGKPEEWVSGSVEVGYRWMTGVGGSFDTYRSIVNLGSGPKLLNFDLRFLDPSHRFFDDAQVRGRNIGGDPYATYHFELRKNRWYELRGDYRDLAYFNALPSYADPLLSRGLPLNQQSLDTHRRLGNFSLDLLPNNWWTPYVEYDRSGVSGTGVAVFVSDGNQYAVPTGLNDLTNQIRGGVRFTLSRLHLTLEQGATMFREDQRDYLVSAGPDIGNVWTPVLGQRLYANSLLQAYGMRGSSIYSRGLLAVQAASWLDISGEFVFSQPDDNVTYQRAANGNFVQINQLLFYNSQRALVNSAAKMPHTLGSLNFEVRPIRRLRFNESWLTDRLHNNGSSALQQALTSGAITTPSSALLASTLTNDYSHQESELFFDVTSRLVLRGGYRYVWGNASEVTLPLAGLQNFVQGRFHRNVAIGGFSYRPGSRFSASGDVERGVSTGAYFRTSVFDYWRARARGRYQIAPSLQLSATFSLLDNQNPTTGVGYDFRAQQESLTLSWQPNAAKMGSIEASYDRSTVRSDLSYLVPQNLTTAVSYYRENAHLATLLWESPARASTTFAPRLALGGSMFLSSGSRPTTYYQPLVSVSMPIHKKVVWFAEWRYHGFGEDFFQYENFRTHLVTSGLRLQR